MPSADWLRLECQLCRLLVSPERNTFQCVLNDSACLHVVTDQEWLEGTVPFLSRMVV